MPEEFEWEGEDEQFEFTPEVEFGAETSMESPLSEADELELAAELLEISSEVELDRFLGDLITKAGRAAGGVIRTPIGRALGGLLKGAAKKALPFAKTALGTALGGTGLGSKLASTAASMFGLELEGLSGEDQEFEVARRFVRFAGAAARRAATALPGSLPLTAARAAAVAAARSHAPGLLRDGTTDLPSQAAAGRSGRWVRRGRQIIVFNCGQ